MTVSGRLINYRLRPAKNVERKMLKEILAKLSSFYSLNSYQYIGFGSHYFSDFILFHKYLHISDMISMEKDIANKTKYNFNLPLSCIHIEFGESNELLPKFNYEKPTILWLDYDKRFNPSMLEDIDTFAQNCISGSTLFISFNSQPHRLNNLKAEFEVEEDDGLYERKIRLEVSDQYFPHDFTEKGIRRWENYSNLIRNSITSRIIDTLTNRNISDKKYFFKQLCFFNYKDDAEMTTIGFIFFEEKDHELYDLCKFNELDFFQEREIPYEINIPNLTLKEIKTLMENMPHLTENKLPKGIFQKNDIENFRKIYKYFPTYLDVDYG